MKIGSKIKIKGDVPEIPSAYFYEDKIEGENGIKFTVGGNDTTRKMKENVGLVVDKYADWNMIQYVDENDNTNILGVKDEFLELLEEPALPVIEEVQSDTSSEELDEIITKFFE